MQHICIHTRTHRGRGANEAMHTGTKTCIYSLHQRNTYSKYSRWWIDGLLLQLLTGAWAGGFSPGVGVTPQQLHQQKVHSSMPDDSWSLQPGSSLHSLQAAGQSQNPLLSVVGLVRVSSPSSHWLLLVFWEEAFEDLPSPTSLLLLPEGMFQFEWGYFTTMAQMCFI